MPDPIYRGEGILLRWGESSANGRTVTFQIGDGPDDAERHPFYGLKTGKEYGQRFALVAVPLAENENDSAVEPSSALPLSADTVGPEEVGSAATAHPATARPALTEGEKLVQMSGILCGDERFQNWLAIEFGMNPGFWDELRTTQWLRAECGIASRRALATNEPAQQKFRGLVARYKLETGQMAEPRG